MRKTCLVALLAAAAWYASAGCRGTGRDIRIDGRFDDWNGVPPAYTDPAGDGTSGGIDLGRVWLADNRDFLYLRFELGKEISIQTGNGLVLYLDTDNSRDTGLPVGDMGADFSWRFGERKGFLHRGDKAIPYIKITRELLDLDKWDTTSIIKRTNELFDLVIGQWPIPK